jgi:hypothetical protein
MTPEVKKVKKICSIVVSGESALVLSISEKECKYKRI